jgi:hypothetical protein
VNTSAWYEKRKKLNFEKRKKKKKKLKTVCSGKKLKTLKRKTRSNIDRERAEKLENGTM